MKRGRPIEQGSPFELIKQKGEFFDMVMHTGKNAQLIIAKAAEYEEHKNKIKDS